MKYILDKNTYLLGDVHGNLRGLSHFITDTDEHNDCSIVVLGDCGLMSDEWTNGWPSINEKAKAKNIKIYILRGNHDNPDFFKHDNSLENIIVLEDFDEVYYYQNEHCFTGLIYGGSLSVDRSWRWNFQKETGKVIWFKDEVLKEIPELVFENADRYDFILGHGGLTPPSIEADPTFIMSFIPNDPELLNDIKKEQDQYKHLLAELKPNYFFYGHFHISEQFRYNDIKCQALDINEFIKLDLQKKYEELDK